MIRSALFFLQLILLVLASVWLANEPGTVTIVWRDWRIDPPIGVLVLMVALLALAAAVCYRFWRYLRQAPGRLLSSHHLNRERKGYRELAQGMISLAAGDAAGALRHANRADTLLGAPAAGHLLIAQAASLQGKAALAKEHFQAIQLEGDAGLAGLRGLFDQAMAAGDKAEALRLGEKIRDLKPDAVWILPQLFDLQITALDWVAADKTITEAIRHLAVPLEEGKKNRALVLYERGRSASDLGDTEAAIGFMREAYDLDPMLVSSSIEYARLLNANGKKRRALRVLEQTWARTNYPGVAHEYASMETSDLSIDRFKALQKLITHSDAGADGAFLLAEYAFKAQLWGEARRHLSSILQDRPTASSYLLMADIEEDENGNIEAADTWRRSVATAAADKSWICEGCGVPADEWSTACGNCGAFGVQRWKTPLSVLPSGQIEYSGSFPLLSNVAGSN
jgi:HemY protein